jgi:outer membrane protein assembly factor BamE (lipoprotein component of BamABCDE complex)
MAKKKRLLLIASLPLTIALTLGVLAMLPPPPGVTKANFDRIQEGMTRAEVEEIFGKPPLSDHPFRQRILDGRRSHSCRN